MAVARSIFTLDGGFQLFCAAFDMPMTGVPLEVALGWQKFYFWAFQKNNHASDCQVGFFYKFFEMPKKQFFCILIQLQGHIKSCPKQLNPST